MTTEDVYKKLTETFHSVFDDDSIVLKPELAASDVDEWDSLAHVRLMLTIEKSFGIKFSAPEIGRLKNVGDLAVLIQSKVK
jgi:acyl carrier protein